MGVVLQAVFGVLVLKTGVGRALFTGANKVFTQLLGFTEQGARFIFGNLVNSNVPVGIPSGNRERRHAQHRQPVDGWYHFERRILARTLEVGYGTIRPGSIDLECDRKCVSSRIRKA